MMEPLCSCGGIVRDLSRGKGYYVITPGVEIVIDERGLSCSRCGDALEAELCQHSHFGAMEERR
mgnify:CR=1 FL=1